MTARHQFSRVLLLLSFCFPVLFSASAQESHTLLPAQKSSVVYRNAQYDFCLVLPESWKGYTVTTLSWDATATRPGRGKPLAGPQLRLRHPLWSQQNPYEDIPILVLTSKQWKRTVKDQYVFGAAPVGPEMIGHSKRYVFALPPRYNYDLSTGYEIVDHLLHDGSLHAPCNKLTDSFLQK